MKIIIKRHAKQKILEVTRECCGSRVLLLLCDQTHSLQTRACHSQLCSERKAQSPHLRNRSLRRTRSPLYTTAQIAVINDTPTSFQSALSAGSSTLFIFLYSHSLDKTIKCFIKHEDINILFQNQYTDVLDYLLI